MTRPQVSPDLARPTERLADHDVVPLELVLPAADETPVRLMQRLGVGEHCFLLASGTLLPGVHGFPFLGHVPLEVAAQDGDDPLRPLEAVLAERVAPVDGV